MFRVMKVILIYSINEIISLETIISYSVNVSGDDQCKFYIATAEYSEESPGTRAGNHVNYYVKLWDLT